MRAVARQDYSARRGRQEWTVRLIAPPALITAFFWVTSLNAVSIQEVIPAFALLIIPWASYLQWKRERRIQVPFFAIIALIYWIYYAIPLFWGDRLRPAAVLTTFLPDVAIAQAIWMALVGVLALWLGFGVGLGRRFAIRRVRDVEANPRQWAYMRWMLVVGSVLNLVPSSAYILGAEGRQVVLAFETFVPLVVFFILFRNFLRGIATRFDKYAILVYLVTQFLLGMSSGWLGYWLSFSLTCVIAWVMERGRIPLVPILLAIVYVVFFQMGKEQYRTTYWQGNQSVTSGNPIDKVNAWFQDSVQGWQQAISSGNIGPQMFHASVMRASLLPQTANVIQMTPTYVPFQYGSTYKDLVAALIPRLVWPDKPSANDANRFYQVAYGVTASSSLGSVSISVGTMTEGYINFGWPGVIGIMFLLGLFFDFVSATFLSRDSGIFYSALGVACLMQFISIESQMQNYVSGVIQYVIVALIVFIPATRWTVTRGSLGEVVKRPSLRSAPAGPGLRQHL